jgi:hypothetical protein
MAGQFGATSTTDQVLDGIDLSGKRILVTGVSAGLGVETARSLAAHGAQVVGSTWSSLIWRRWRACAPRPTLCSRRANPST